MSTRGGFSAFGVVHFAKSEVAPGKFKRARKLGDKKKEKVRNLVIDRQMARDVNNPPERASAANRSLGHAYVHHAYAMREDAGAKQITTAMKHEIDPTHHTPSAVHPNIHYGPSVNPEMKATLDRSIDPKLAAKSPHPIVIHHVPDLHPQVVAGALGAHPLTGGRGHVAIGPVLHETGHWNIHEDAQAKGITGPRILNHEIAHASLKGKPVHDLKPVRNMGEESRADTVSRAGIYRRSGAIGTPKVLRQVKRDNKTLPKEFRVPKAELAAHGAYHRVARLVERGMKLR
jgi:hypothetical protein